MSIRISMAAGACLAVAATLSIGFAQAQTFYLGAEGGWTVISGDIRISRNKHEREALPRPVAEDDALAARLWIESETLAGGAASLA